MRIIILTQYYPPETGAPQNRLSNLAQRFKSMGHDVCVLTAKPNYPRGSIYSGFEKGIVSYSLQNDVSVTHCWLFTTQSKNLFLRLINYFSFVVSSMVIGTLILPRSDLLLVESPPLFLSISAWWLSRIKGARMIINVSDLYPETAISLGMLEQKWLQKLFYLFEAWSYHVSCLITGQTEGIVKSIRKRFPEKEVYLLTNGIDLDEMLSVEIVDKVDNTSSPQKFIIGYAGILGYAQNLQTAISAAEIIRGEKNIHFHIYGDGPQKDLLIRQVNDLKLTNVKIMGHLSHQEIIVLMQEWNVGLVPLVNTSLMAGALPSKMFEVMGMKLPVLLSAPEGEASLLVARANAGLWVYPENPRLLADAVLNLYSNLHECEQMGKNGFEYVVKHYNRRDIIERFAHYLQSTILD